MWTALRQTCLASPPTEESPRTCLTRNSTMRPSGKRYLHHCSLKRGESADGRQAYHSNEESLLPAQSFFAHSRTERPVHELSSLSSCTEKPSREMETKQSGFSLNDKSKFSLIVEQRFTNTSSKPILIGEVFRNLNGIIESQRREIDYTLAGDEELRRDQQLHHEQLSEQNRDLREAHMKSFNEMEELNQFQGSTIDGFSRRNWSKIETLSLNSQPRFRNYRMKLIVWMIREIFKDAESVRSGQSHVTSQPAFSPPFRDPDGMLSRSLGMLSRNDKPPDIWDTHGISGNVFVNPPASSSSPYPGEFNPWISNVTEDTSPHVTSERQNPDTTLDPRCQSGPSARFIRPLRGKIFKELWGRPTTTADFGSSFWQIP